MIITHTYYNWSIWPNKTLLLLVEIDTLYFVYEIVGVLLNGKSWDTILKTLYHYVYI